MTPYKVLVADDHPLAREAIRSLLEDDDSFQIIAEARDGREAVSLCEELKPDLVLMDINMPHVDGLEATRLIKKSRPEIKLVILSVSDNVADLFTAIQFGAQGYLLKNLEPDDWLTYLHALLDEDAEIPREMAGRILTRFQSGGEISGDVLPDVLTPREREILAHVAVGATNKQIAEKLVIAENTVKNHMKNVLDKLHLQNRVQLAAYAVRHGLKTE
ncbi:response regulator transcription factor [Tumebacillus sp. ITR2]|uniref:Response regulator transcription factor n=1 Tax=Tumebacillus amylolyticus TaxID=2801339 RepID=A0ABS1JA96_9BACL|nr:response regulator transcription factor [Tumebacillus amylolyticus]MBL0387196.1 response regulator transcription factor [Tumebacillus amylolyticus]